ncbi:MULTISPECIES: hypothetical protein [unclassified Streptomyces]|uniref:hypothetical protein n=1 Tax=unclassified Streptomyces TaxID=2593676 RepID=UPI002B1CDC3C|nr:MULTISPECIES: hypothetical protein [unclassified Streptomyces]
MPRRLKVESTGKTSETGAVSCPGLMPDPRQPSGNGAMPLGDVVNFHFVELADLGRSGHRPPWADLMAAKHCKTLVVCGTCHADIHGKNPGSAPTE